MIKTQHYGPEIRRNIYLTVAKGFVPNWNLKASDKVNLSSTS
jgi:hypothetical protein